MTGTVTSSRLRELAEFRAESGCAISLYLGFDPSTVPTIPDAFTKINSLTDEAQKSAFANRSELTHEQKVGLQGDFERIRRFLTEEFDRDGVRGVAIFAAGLDNFWSANGFSDVVGDEARVGPFFYLTPLVPLLGRGEGAIVAVVGRERGSVFVLRGGRLEEVADHTEEQPYRRTDQGGWSQARYQRHVDELAGRHLRTVADELDRQVRAGARQVIIFASEENRSVLDDVLSHDASKAVIGWGTDVSHASPVELLGQARPFLDQSRAAEESEALERWQEEAGRNGRAASGWADALEAASDSRVELLLFHEGVNRRAYQCPSCGRAQVEDGNCPLDGTRMEVREDGIDLAVHLTLEHGGDVRALGRDRPELGPVEGIAALLRF
jgi:peptide chain release factor subunit 1